MSFEFYWRWFTTSFLLLVCYSYHCRLAAKDTELSTLTKEVDARNTELSTLKQDLEKQKKKNNVSGWLPKVIGLFFCTGCRANGLQKCLQCLKKGQILMLTYLLTPSLMTKHDFRFALLKLIPFKDIDKLINISKQEVNKMTESMFLLLGITWKELEGNGCIRKIRKNGFRKSTKCN